MTNRLNKVKSIIILFIISALMFTAGALISYNGSHTVNAEGTAVFTMAEKIEARIKTPSGLRFKANFNGTVKEEIESAKEFGFLIAPTSYFDGITADYMNALADKVVVKVDKSKIVEEGIDRYYATAVLYNILEANWELDFSAVAYYIDAQDNATYTVNETLPSASINTIINASFFSADGTAETRAQLFTYLNYGGDSALDFTYDFDGEEGPNAPETITVPAHPIRVNNEKFDFIVNLNYGESGDPMYSYILTEDINCYFTPGLNYIYDKDFGATLDGDGYKISYVLNTAIDFKGLFKSVSGVLKNVVINADVTMPYANQYSFAETVSGKLENVVFELDFKTNAYANKYETSPSSGIIGMVEGDAELNNIVVYDKSQGIHQYCVVKGGEGQSINNFVFVGSAVNKGVPGWNGSYTWGWRKLPFNVDGAHMELNNFYMYSSLKTAIEGEGKYVENFDYAEMPHGSVEDVNWYATTTEKANDVIDNFTFEYYEDELANRKGYRVKLGTKVVVDEASKMFEEVNTVEEFITAMTSGASTRFDLKTDIVITDAELDANSTFQSSAYTFPVDFKGTLNGGKHTVTFNVATMQIRNADPWFGIFETVSGNIVDTTIIVKAINYMGGNKTNVLAGTLSGKFENSILAYDITPSKRFNGVGGYGYPSPIGTLGASAQVNNSLFVGVGYGNGYGEYQIARDASATTKISNVGLVAGEWGTARLAKVLPATKANVSNVYMYNSVANAIAGKHMYALDNAKYASGEIANASAPADLYVDNTSYATTKAIAEILGYEVQSFAATVKTYTYNVADMTYSNVADGKLDVIDFLKPVEISTSKAFVDAMNTGAGSYILKNDITITDTAYDANSEVQSRGNTFDTEFKGVLDGNGYTITFNVNTEGLSYFSGVYKKISGVIKNAHIVLSIRTPFNEGKHGIGHLANTLEGSIQNCIITYTTQNAKDYGYAALISTLGASAEIKDCVLVGYNSYTEGGVIAEYASETSKITNVAVVSNKLHYNTYYLGKILPTTKCNVNGVYVYDSVTKLVAGKADYALDATKYNAEGAPANITYKADADIDTLYSRNVTKSIADILGTQVSYVSGTVSIVQLNSDAEIVNNTITTIVKAPAA